ncbi:hypothetical protein DL95DRAFT_443406 [Leptodontidium sp. 2 PMI_412]|nr:hypothetical protein DL95DRAFT_443406 [Leptodontidium sp. 2 PMI_412]
MFAKLMGVRMSRCHPVETFASVTVASGLIPHVPRPKPATLNSASITNAHLQDVQIAVGQLALTAIHADVTILTVQTLVPGAGTAVATIRVARRDVLSHLCRYCVDHTCSEDHCFNWRHSRSGTTCLEHNVQALIPLATTNPPRQRQSTQPDMSQAYGSGYLEGLAHGLNVDPQDQEEARRLFGNLDSYRPRDQNPHRRAMEDLVNGAIKRGGRKGTKKIPDAEEQGGGDGH